MGELIQLLLNMRYVPQPCAHQQSRGRFGGLSSSMAGRLQPQAYPWTEEANLKLIEASKRMLGKSDVHKRPLSRGEYDLKWKKLCAQLPRVRGKDKKKFPLLCSRHIMHLLERYRLYKTSGMRRPKKGMTDTILEKMEEYAQALLLSNRCNRTALESRSGGGEYRCVTAVSMELSQTPTARRLPTRRRERECVMEITSGRKREGASATSEHSDNDSDDEELPLEDSGSLPHRVRHPMAYNPHQHHHQRKGACSSGKDIGVVEISAMKQRMKMRLKLAEEEKKNSIRNFSYLARRKAASLI